MTEHSQYPKKRGDLDVRRFGPHQSVDVGLRDPDYPYRSVLPWRVDEVENYTICCPRCGSYKLGTIQFITMGDRGFEAHFWCDDCKQHGGIGFFTTDSGLMLATD